MIKNIIFDLGGVLIPLNMKATSDAFKNLGAAEFDNIYSQQKQQSFFDLFDKGLISDIEFREEVKKYIQQKVSNQQIDDAWNAMLALIPQEKINWLKKIKSDYRIYLLSNTNNIHVEKFESDHESFYGEPVFKTIFDKTYYSCRMGMRKPDKEIFDFVINNSKLNPVETIFIDDTQQHVEGAKLSGLQAFYLNLKEESVETLLQGVLKWNR